MSHLSGLPSPALYLLGVLGFLGALVVSIALHELGHLLPAKAFGMKVTDYSVGIGPALWRRRHGETEYAVRALPMAGYVRIAGMLGPTRDDEPDRDQPHRLYCTASWWRQVVVMAGGPIVNLTLAFSCFWLLFATYGNPQDLRVHPQVAEVVACVPKVAGGPCRPGDPASPASRAGFRTGDRIVAVGGVAVQDWPAASARIRAHRGGALTVTVLRAGEPVELRTSTVPGPALRGRGESGYLGLAPRVERARGGPAYTVDRMAAMTGRTVGMLLDFPSEVGKAGLAVLGVGDRAPAGPVSAVGASRIAGGIAADRRTSSEDRAASLLALVGGVNLFLGVANLVPLLPLDGGRIAAALWQGLRVGVARLRRRPAPPPMDLVRLLPVTLVVAGTIAVMSGVLVIADVVAPVPDSTSIGE